MEGFIEWRDFWNGVLNWDFQDFNVELGFLVGLGSGVTGIFRGGGL